MRSQPIRMEVTETDGVPVARLEGEIDISNAPGLASQLAAAVVNSAPGMVIDISRITYLDSAGVTLLFDLGRRLQTRQQELRLVVPEDALPRRILMMTDMDKTVPIHADVDEAVARILGLKS